MANSVQLNFQPFLQTHYQTLSAHPGSPLKEYYNKPDVLDRIMTTYVNSLKETVHDASACGGTFAFAVAWFTGMGVPGIVLTSLGGAAGGAAAGVVYETVRLAIEIRLSKDYISWKNSVEGPVLKDFAKILENQVQFKDFLCDLTHDFPEIPVRDSLGRLYNQEAIFKWIDEKGIHPFTSEPMTRKDVSFCSSFAIELKKRMNVGFFNGDLIELAGQHSDEIIKGLKSALSAVIENHNNIIFKRAKQEMEAAERRGLSPVESNRIYQRHIADIIDDMPKIEKPKGLAAILTIESIKDLDLSLLKETRAVACEVVSRLAGDDHEE